LLQHFRTGATRAVGLGGALNKSFSISSCIYSNIENHGKSSQNVVFAEIEREKREDCPREVGNLFITMAESVRVERGELWHEVDKFQLRLMWLLTQMNHNFQNYPRMPFDWRASLNTEERFQVIDQLSQAVHDALPQTQNDMERVQTLARGLESHIFMKGVSRVPAVDLGKLL
jgi:hypothetical protein